MFAIGDDKFPGLAKLQEEMNELGVELSKLTMTKGSYDYWGNRSLKAGIEEEEVADVLAALIFFSSTAENLDGERMANRSNAKYKLFWAWHEGNSEAKLEDFL